MKYVIGNLLDAEQKYILHGCNAQGVMGAGVALAIKNKWPSVYEGYRQFCLGQMRVDPDTTELLGSWYIVDTLEKGKQQYVINMITQDLYLRDSRQVNYYAIARGLADLADDYGNMEIALPRIGAGLGGGSWEFISQLLEDVEKMTELRFTVYDLEEIPGTVYTS